MDSGAPNGDGDENDATGGEAETPVACVRVPRAEGEATRRELAEAELIAESYEIAGEDGHLYIPVTDPAAVPEGLELATHAVGERERQTTPADLLGSEPSYERIGDVVLIDEDDPERARAIARAVVESDLPVETVLNKASKVKGEKRVREWELLAGEGTETVHREYGCEYLLDLAAVYFSPRLATERHRVTEQIREGERVFDMFAGVGPFVIPAAKRGATAVGCDVNGRAIEYLRENARRNGVADRVTAIEGDVREAADDYGNWADRIVMNLPHSADEFLETAIALAGDDCVIHYYDIQHEEDPFGPGERAIRAAAGGEYEVTVETRHTVRSYAPHEENICLDVRLER
ncbi:class I SAM-dependent methyltransferase family protein [Saliphagus sp. LR7]|uniref:class I SAM-dependent methyltransferase n=1 Tax=Saliphagus sp. LR7 TaxID=2282654 RepID=UPI000DF80580|nr:class I SAM-dependent methyltransferase family protein [Saliphagus sp. LR7]